MSLLRAELSSLQSVLPAPCLRRVWPPIAHAVDDFMYAQLVRRTHFSPDGALQLRRDADALLAVFSTFHSRPHVPLRRLHESAALLTSPRESRQLLKDVLMSGGNPGGKGGRAPMGEQAAAEAAEVDASLRRKLEERGVYRLSPGEAAELLSCVHDDDEA